MFLMKISNTLPERNQQRVYKHTNAAVKRQIDHVENPTAAMGIRVEAAHVNNAIVLHYLTSEVVLEEPEIGSIDPTSQ